MDRATMRAKALGATLAVASALSVGAARAEVGSEGFDALAGIEAGQVDPMSLPELEGVQGKFAWDPGLDRLVDNNSNTYRYQYTYNERLDVYLTSSAQLVYFDKWYNVVWIPGTTIYIDDRGGSMSLVDASGAFWATQHGSYFSNNNGSYEYWAYYDWYTAWIKPSRGGINVGM